MASSGEKCCLYRWEDDKTGKYGPGSLTGILSDDRLLGLNDGKVFKRQWPEPAEDGTIASYPARKETYKIVGGKEQLQKDPTSWEEATTVELERILGHLAKVGQVTEKTKENLRQIWKDPEKRAQFRQRMRKRLGGGRTTTERVGEKRENDPGFLSGKFSAVKTLSQLVLEQKARLKNEQENKSELLAIKKEAPSSDDSRNSEGDSDVINYKDLGFVEMPTLSKISPKSDSDQ